jgi:predicted metal-dependent hydrolase
MEATSTIPLRRLDLPFDADAVPRDFYGGDAMKTLMMCALSVVFPEGERFFVESVMRYKDRVSDPKLRAEMRGFAAQEGMHSKEHSAFNAMLRAQGLTSVERFEKEVKWLLRRVRRLRTPEQQLAITCALEHFTSIMGEQLLSDAEHRESIDASVRNLWVWHALEESEHRAVAFDVYQAVDGSYGRRVRMMALATFGFMVFIGRIHLAMIRERGLGGDVRGLVRTFDFFWLRRGLFRTLVPAYLAYYRRDFHPDQRDNRALLREWRERLFGETGELRAELERGSRKEPKAA